MITLDDLRDRTMKFLDLHWLDDEPRPEWSTPWTFVGTIPNQEIQGVYTLVHGDVVVYVGLGAGNNSGQYEGAGLGLSELKPERNIIGVGPRDTGGLSSLTTSRGPRAVWSSPSASSAGTGPCC